MKPARKRNRHQSGYVELDKSVSPHMWKARYQDWSSPRIDKQGRTRPTQRSVRLGPKVTGGLETKSSAQAKWDQIKSRYIKKGHAAAPVVPHFEHYALECYMPTRSAARGWRLSTRNRFLYYIRILTPKIGSKQLSVIKASELQSILNDVAGKYCHDTANGILTYLRAIFDYAVDDELVSRNPARKLVLPPTRERNRPAATNAQVAQLEVDLAGPDRLILKLLTRCGLRPGEVFGLKWKDLQDDKSLLIVRTFSKGRIGDTKTRSSQAKVVVPAALYEELLALRASSGDEDWIFPSKTHRASKGRPVSSENWLKRVLKPAAAKLGFSITLHSFRRGWATQAHYLGAADKDIQRQLRHSKASMTTDVYIRPVEESVRATVEKVDQALTQAAAKLEQQNSAAANTTSYATLTEKSETDEEDVNC